MRGGISDIGPPPGLPHGGRIGGHLEDLKDHMILVLEAFDTATAFTMSFGIAKFALAQWEAKLVGEIVGRFGRSPNHAIVRAINNWPEIYTKKTTPGVFRHS